MSHLPQGRCQYMTGLKSLSFCPFPLDEYIPTWHFHLDIMCISNSTCSKEIPFFSPKPARSTAFPILVDNNCIFPVAHVNSPGVISELIFLSDTPNTRKSWWLYLQNVSRIQPLLTTILVQASIISCLDCCNGLLIDPVASTLVPYNLFTTE